MPFATLNRLNLYFERDGDGPPLLFISGTGGDLRVQPNVFASSLDKAFDLLAYDQRALRRCLRIGRAETLRLSVPIPTEQMLTALRPGISSIPQGDAV